MKQVYKTQGVCAPYIEYDVDDNGILHDVKFLGGCLGNSKGISNLVEGMHVDEVIKKLKGVNCRMGTSCPDQLARALQQRK